MENREAPTRGFHHSSVRLFTELGVVLGGVVALIFLAVTTASWLAHQLVDEVSVEWESQLGAVTWAHLTPPEKRCDHPEMLAYLETVTGPLLEALDSPYDFKFVVVDNPVVNAFALPGGFVTVNRGLLEEAKSGEEVAAVLAHEIHHVTQRHGLRRMAQQMSVWSLLGWALGMVELGALSTVAVGLVTKGYDRDQEREADRMGHELLRKASIDPKGMAIFFSKLAETGPRGATLFSTHPASEERARSAQALPGLDTTARRLGVPGSLPCHRPP